MTAQVITAIQEMQDLAAEVRSSGKRIALVPTMGALHEGHLALIRKAAKVADWVITSVFVNPTQFGPGEDLGRYPRDPERDVERAAEAGTHVVFMPEASEMYPDGYQTYVIPEGPSDELEGFVRPGHFRGVGTVVTKLLNITMPHVALFGQKDAQQAFIIRRLIRDLNINTAVLVEPTVRESDGLAMSSRNRYLSPDERSRATSVFRALKRAEAVIQAGERSSSAISQEVQRELRKSSPTAVDYVAVLNPETFRPVDRLSPGPIMVALAVRFGSTRLLDNVIIEVR